jgi:Family of unknown function (DUF6527)
VTRRTSVTHEFVEFIPEQLVDGVIYISIPFATTVHKCCSGCGREVVTPIKPDKWHVTFDGESISLAPSIGNWSLPCQSHYWIKRNQVRWDRRRTQAEIDAGRARRGHATELPPEPTSPKSFPQVAGAFSGWRRLLKWLRHPAGRRGTKRTRR